MKTLPTVDISALHDRTDSGIYPFALQELKKAFHETGFAAIVGHGIPTKLIADMQEQVGLLFSRPLVEKQSLRVSQENYRGYIPMGFFTPNAGGDRSDQYEGYKLHEEISASHPVCGECALYGPNKWPEDSEQLQQTVAAYWQQCDRVRDLLLSAIAGILGRNIDYFRSHFELSLTNMTLLHYPASEPDGDHFGIHPHKDTDVLTILAPDPVGGLMLRPTGSDEWIHANAAPDALIVNVGDMLEIWSDEYFVSTPHKVVNTSGRERYSFPYFAVPRYDTLIHPLAGKKTQAQKSREMHCGDVSAKIWQSNWPDAAAIEQRYDPYIN